MVPIHIRTILIRIMVLRRDKSHSSAPSRGLRPPSWQLAAGSWQLAAGSWQLAAGDSAHRDFGPAPSTRTGGARWRAAAGPRERGRNSALGARSERGGSALGARRERAPSESCPGAGTRYARGSAPFRWRSILRALERAAWPPAGAPGERAEALPKCGAGRQRDWLQPLWRQWRRSLPGSALRGSATSHVARCM